MNPLNSISKQQLLMMGASILIVIVIVWHILNVIDRNMRIKNNTGASLSKKYNRNIYRVIYRGLNRFSLTRNYVDKINRRYELLYPGEAEDIIKKTIRTTLFTWSASAAAIVLIWLWNMNFINTMVSVLVVYVLNFEIIGYMVTNTELILLEDMVLFISNLRHNFYVNRMIDEAIFLSMKDMGRYENTSSFLHKFIHLFIKRNGYEMKAHADKLYEIVISSDIKEEVLNYNSTVHNRYMKILLSLCVNVMEYGDKIVKGENLFAANLENLKKQINIEIIKMKKLRYKFSGFTFITIAVCIPLDLIRKFAIDIVPELYNFYNGRNGSIYVTVTVIAAFTIYQMNNQIKAINRPLPNDNIYLKRLEKHHFIRSILDNYTEKNESKMYYWKELLKIIGESLSPRQFVLKKIIYTVVVFITSIVFMIFLHEMNRDNIAGKVIVLPANITAANKVQVDLMKETITKYVQVYTGKEKVIQKTIEKELAAEGTFYQANINTILAGEIVRRVNCYKSEYFKWYDLLVCFGLSIIAYYIPNWTVLRKKKFMRLNMDDEVNQFNSIIYMLMYRDQITVKDLLEEMELFAVVFRQTIHECINDYNSGDIEAMEQMKEKESFGPFIRLVDNLIRCDDIAIYKAFDEIASDRESYYERRILEDEINIQRKVDLAQPMSWVPCVLVMIYLILPIASSALDAFQSFKQMAENI